MKPRKQHETDAEYIARLEAANAGLRRRNKEVTKWAAAINRAVTQISTDASLVFQAMAEKAHVRSHPSVTKAVEMFDSIAHPQWQDSPKGYPLDEWPTDWDFDTEGAWSGDADMQLNAPIADAFEYFETRRFNCSEEEARRIDEIALKLNEILEGRIEGVKDAAGFQPRQISVPTTEHCNDMSAEELREIVSAMGWMALDIAQDLSFANRALRRDLRAAAYRAACADCYSLADFAYRPRDPKIDIKVFGGAAPF